MGRASEKSRLKTVIDSPAVSIAVLVGFLGFWELAVIVLGIPKIVLPLPSSIAVSLWDGFASGLYLWHLAITFYEIIVGFLVGAVSGLVIGFIVALSPVLERIFYPYVVAFQTIPKVAIAPIIVIWFGYGTASKIVITATIGFFPVLANTIVGLRAAPHDQLEMLTAYTATRWQLFRMVRLPQALPYIFVGLDVAIVLSVIGAIVGEFVGAKAGLGFLILQMNFNFDMAGTFAVLLVLSAIGVGLHWMVNWAQRRVVFWMDDTSDRTIGA